MIRYGLNDFGNDLEPDPDGAFVLYEDARKFEAERDKAWADMDRLRVGADAEITKLEEQRDRARDELAQVKTLVRRVFDSGDTQDLLSRAVLAKESTKGAP
jgi:predicted  nucleic acid-binding Zn-ribbon protein